MTDAICKHGNAISLKPSYNFVRCAKCDAETDARARKEKLTPVAELVPLACTGCGSTETMEQIRAKHPNALSCCPERDMRPVPPLDEIAEIEKRHEALSNAILESEAVVPRVVMVESYQSHLDVGALLRILRSRTFGVDKEPAVIGNTLSHPDRLNRARMYWNLAPDAYVPERLLEIADAALSDDSQSKAWAIEEHRKMVSP